MQSCSDHIASLIRVVGNRPAVILVPEFFVGLLWFLLKPLQGCPLGIAQPTPGQILSSLRRWSRVSHCILPCYEAHCCLNNISVHDRVEIDHVRVLHINRGLDKSS
eukprot:sb/3477786/